MADMYGIAQIEVLYNGSGISGVMVHIVAFWHLAWATVTAAIESDNPVAVLGEEQHLGIPVIGAEWPVMVKNDWLAAAPIFAEDLDAVLRSHCLHDMRRTGWNGKRASNTAVRIV
jgi:hypothetical protein